MSYHILIEMPRRYHTEVADAKMLDRIGRQHGQRDACHHLCALQNQHLREGLHQYCIYRTIYGYQFGDTHNDGQQRLLHRGATAAEAYDAALAWHAEKPSMRGLILRMTEAETLEFLTQISNHLACMQPGGMLRRQAE